MPRVSRFAQQCQAWTKWVSIALLVLIILQFCSMLRKKSTFPTSPWDEQSASNRRMIALARFLHRRYGGDTSQMRPADAQIYERYVNYIDPRSPLESNSAFPDTYSSEEEDEEE